MRTSLPRRREPDLAELARQQGVQPVANLDEWLAQLPPDEPPAGEDDILEPLLRLRRELRKTEARL